MKHIVLAIDSFKGCLTSVEAEDAAETGVGERWSEAEIIKVPVTDGGDGMMSVFSRLLACQEVTIDSHDALMRPIRAAYAVCADNTVILETALSCGISLLNPQELSPLRATTYGVGELFADALRRGYRRFVIGLGGSATSDCGLGMLAALRDVLGENWRNQFLHELDITLASDVDNPLFGKRGAAAVFGPQKGATSEVITCLDRRARTFARMAASQLGFDHSQDSGAGAAGGLGYAFLQFMNAKVRSGADVLLETVNFDSLIENADLIITGEGSADAQTLMGKIPAKVLEYGLRKEIPVVLIAGKVTGTASLLKAGFARVQCITPPGMPLTEALKPATAKENIRKTVAKILRYKTGCGCLP